MADFTSRFNELLARQSATDAELAEALGVSKQTISAWKTGVRSPKKPTIRTIADHFGVGVPWLMGITDDDVDATREDLRDDPDRMALLKLARYGTAQDVRQVAALIDALRATNPDFYDGDDPA